MSVADIKVDYPFPGLRPFREEEEHLFFGREKQVDTMIDKLAATSFLAVVGSSGSGKTSLVNCGLRPALHRGFLAKAGTSWRVAQFRPGSNPVRAIARALAADGVLFDAYQPEGLSLQEIVEATLRMSKLGVADVYEQARPNRDVNLILIADQFEELFRYRGVGSPADGDGTSRNSQAMALVNLLLEANAQAEFPIYVVLTMRSDFLGECAQFPGLAEAINKGQYLVPRMTRSERKAAIAGPVAVAGAELDPVLLTRLVNDVGDNPDQLSILQHALNRTWDEWQRKGHPEAPLDLTQYNAIGTMAFALDQHADEAYKQLGSTRLEDVCKKIFKALTDKGTDARGIRRPASMAALCALAAASREEVTQVIDVFREPKRSFLMPPLPEVLEPETIIDISHESLMRVWVRLKKWTDEEALSARLYRRLSETAALETAGKSSLWRDPELEVALTWRREENPTAAWADLYGGGFETAMAFLDRSAAEREKEEREKAEHLKREADAEKALALAEEQKRTLALQTQSAHRLRIFAVSISVMLVLALGALGWGYFKTVQTEEAHQQVQTALQAVFSATQDLPSAQVKKVEAGLDPRMAAKLPRVYLQIVDNNDRPFAKKMGNLLQKAGYLVLGVELRSDVVLKASQVKYYRDEDGPTAAAIVKILVDAGDKSAQAANLQKPNLQRNQFEVWFKKQSAAAE